MIVVDAVDGGSEAAGARCRGKRRERTVGIRGSNVAAVEVGGLRTICGSRMRVDCGLRSGDRNPGREANDECWNFPDKVAAPPHPFVETFEPGQELVLAPVNVAPEIVHSANSTLAPNVLAAAIPEYRWIKGGPLEVESLEVISKSIIPNKSTNRIQRD
ncbi:hypothetical protein M407DRAFT_234806 [Tulasnella calospora MUT 4182]|uniref:Uncharacterized protein n=1 Tax=Tulasnella calospora MUT 4182 TaxID=1051891 RepID=A0A0C3QID4_9AGAM|nr:hypothetical protein M407DRAFT_234806 [Tulasnella calospora MUT 4182]